jgi:hypothetical protein
MFISLVSNICFAPEVPVLTSGAWFRAGHITDLQILTSGSVHKHFISPYCATQAYSLAALHAFDAFIPNATPHFLLSPFLSTSNALLIQLLHPVPQNLTPQTVFSHSLTHSLTHSWSWALLEKLPTVQPLKKFPALYGTRRFITVFSIVVHWTLS